MSVFLENGKSAHFLEYFLILSIFFIVWDVKEAYVKETMFAMQVKDSLL